MAPSGRLPGRWLARPLRQRHDAAKESNLPNRGCPVVASFEDWMGHQARAAPQLILRGRRSGEAGARRSLQALLERALYPGVERVQPIERQRLGRAEAATGC